MTLVLHQCIHLFHEYCTVEEIRQLRLVSNDFYDVIATCEEVGTRLMYECSSLNEVTAQRKPFTKINLHLDWFCYNLDDLRIKSICTSLGRKLHIEEYHESSFELKDTSVQNLELECWKGCRKIESIVLHPELKHLKLVKMSFKKVSVLKQIMSYDLITLSLQEIQFDESESDEIRFDESETDEDDESDPVALDLTTMTNLEELRIYDCQGIQSVTLPTSLNEFCLVGYDGTLIGFESCTDLKTLEIVSSKCFDYTDLDLSTIPLTDLSLYSQSPSSLTLPTSLQKLYINRCDDISTPIDFHSCTNLKELYISRSDCFDYQDIDLSTTSLTKLTLFLLPLSSLIFPDTLQTLSIDSCDSISTPIDFQRCPNLKELETVYSECFNNTDLDLSTTSLTRLYLHTLCLSSLILPHSMQQSYMRDPSSIFYICDIPKLMIKNIPEPGCTEDSFTILPGIEE